jgi:hypothetical protein
MSMELEDALRDLRHDIDTEMARLIRLGVPPWDAAIQARQRIERQRRAGRSRPPADQGPT